MEKGLRDALRKSRTFLRSNIADIAGVIDHLYVDGILTDSMKETVLMENIQNSDRISALLDLIPKRGQRAYQCLIDALNKTENLDAAQRLVEARDGVVPTSASQYSESPKTEIKQSKVTNPEPPQKTTQQENVKIDEKMEKSKATEKHWLESGKEMFTKSVTPSSQEFYMQKKKEDKSYDLIRKFRGYVIVIINVPVGMKGVNKDSETSRVSDLFKNLGFKFLIPAIKDCSASAMVEKLKSKVEKENFEDAPSCVVVAFTVGQDSDKIYGIEGNDDYVLPQELLGKIKDIPQLRGKPKVLIYQTIPKHVQAEDHSGDEKEIPLEECKFNDEDTFIVTARPCHGCHPVIQRFQYGKEEQDLEGKGTYFMVALIHAIKHNASEKSFLEIMQETHKLLTDTFYVPQIINESDAQDKTDASPFRNMQVASVKIETACKRKDLYLFPGIKEGTSQQATS